MKLNDNGVRDLRSWIQNLIIDKQRSGALLKDIELPPLPEYPPKVSLRERLDTSRKDIDCVQELDVKNEKISFLTLLKTAIQEAKEDRRERKLMKLDYKLNFKGKAKRYNIDRHITLREIAIAEKILNYIELVYIDNDTEADYNPAGGVCSAPISMHSD